MPELMGDHALDLLAVHPFEQAAGHGDRGVLRVATGRERVLATVLDDIGGRHRDVRGDRQLPDDINEHTVPLRIGLFGARPRRG